MHGNEKKETDTEKEKLMYYNVRRSCDCSKIAFFRAYLVTILKVLVPQLTSVLDLHISKKK